MPMPTPTPKPKPKPAEQKANPDLIQKFTQLFEMMGQQDETPFIWMPGPATFPKSSRRKPGYSLEGELPETVGSGGERNPEEIKAWVYDPAQLPAILAYLQARGYQVESFEDVEKIWVQAVDRATNAYMGSGKKLKRSPWDMIDLSAPSPEDDSKAFPWKGERYYETSHTTTINEMGPEQARTMIRQALRQELLREPTQEEIEDFASRANAIVSANPQIQETTDEMEWDPNLEGPGQGGYKQVSSTSRDLGKTAEEVGAMVQNSAIDQARNNPEYGEIQASTTLMNALMEAIASPVD